MPTKCNGIVKALRLPAKYPSSCLLASSKTEEVSALKEAFRYLSILRLLRSAHGLLLQSQRHSLSPKDAKTNSPHEELKYWMLICGMLYMFISATFYATFP